MNAFLYGCFVQWKIDFRNKDILLFYYIAPLLVYLMMGSMFGSIMTGFENNLIMTMSIFCISMGGLLGAGSSLATIYGSDIRKSYQVGEIPIHVPLLQNMISAFVHLFMMAMIIYISGPIIFKASLPSSPLHFFIALIAYILICILISSLFGLIFKTSNKMMMAAQCVFLPSILLSGVMVPTDVLNDTFQMIAHILPAHWGFIQMCADQMIGSSMLCFGIAIPIFAILCFLQLKRISKEK